MEIKKNKKLYQNKLTNIYIIYIYRYIDETTKYSSISL
jgi:hypothetical protein